MSRTSGTHGIQGIHTGVLVEKHEKETRCGTERKATASKT